MAKKSKKERKYFYRACWKPDRLRMLKLLGEKPSEGFDSSGRVLGFVGAYHRINPPYNKYCVANEYICGRIGTFLGLPIPPFAITNMPDGGLCFSSLDFNFSRDKLPPVVADKCVEFMAEVCAGVLAFDILIANEDRHDQNLLVDTVSKPREIFVFDHDQSLLGGAQANGKPRLDKLLNHLGITGKPDIGGNRHIFLDEINDATLLDKWIRRIGEVPTWLIEDACDFASRELGISKDEATAAREFLVHRKNKIGVIIQNNESEFSGVNWPKGLFS